MRIEIYGTGRAAGALALASSSAGHEIVAIHGRSEAKTRRIASLVDQTGSEPELRIIAVADAAIRDVALAIRDEAGTPTIHLSGSRSISDLDVLADMGTAVGSFHPLQTMPDARAGAASLSGAWVAITAPDDFARQLDTYARSLGCRPFRLADEDKAQYHAAASAAANYTNAALDLASRLFDAAGVPFEAAKPLVETTIQNSFTLGPIAARSGPLVRGDDATVQRQREAAKGVGVIEGTAFDAFTLAAEVLISGTADGEALR